MDLRICRICGGDKKLKKILDEDSEIINKLFLCANLDLKPGDIFPKLICTQCEKDLNISYRLRKQCEATQQRLKLQIQIKQSSPFSSPVKIITTQNGEITNECSDYKNQKPKAVDKKGFLIANKVIEENELTEITEKRTSDEPCSIDSISLSGSPIPEYCEDLENEEVKFHLSGKSVFNCDTCNEVFTKKYEYNAHIKQHGKERYQCIQCCKFFPSRFRLKRHEEIHNDIPSYQCSHCNRSYYAIYNLQRHIKSAHSGIKACECKICNISFARVDVLKRHLQLHSDEKKFKCSICSKSFKTSDYLWAHNKKHHTPNSELSKSYKRRKIESASKNQCSYCGRLFKSLFSYKNHLLIHTNEKPYKCDSCNKQFRTTAAMTTHRRIHDDYRPYQCDLCLKSFKQTAHLKEHKILHLQNMPKHVCAICYASFTKKSNLKAHMRIHSKEKPFKCVDCSAEFSYMQLLRRHVSRVHYNLNDAEERLGMDSVSQNNSSLESEMCNYIETLDDGDEWDNNNDKNFVDTIHNDSQIEQ